MSSSTCPVDVPHNRGRAAAIPRLPRGVAFAAAGLLFVVLFAAAAAPSPLFVLFESEWHFAPWLLTTAFAVYAVALLVALLVAGSLSDHIGRRPVILGAVAVQLVSLGLFLSAHDIGTVIGARIIQGLATGLATGALSASIDELAPPRWKRFGAIVTSIAPMAGLALGALGTGLVELAAPDPAPTVFGVLAVLFVLGAVLVSVSPETVERRPGALASLVPRVVVPPAARRAFASAVPVFIATWMTGGFFLGLVPTILVDVLGIRSGLAGAVAITALTGSGALAVLVVGSRDPRRTAIAGVLALVAGLAGVTAGLATASPLVFFVGAVVAGTGFGLAFSAVLRRIIPLAAPHERGTLFSSVYVASYLAFGVPAIAAGLLVSALGLAPTAFGYLAVVLAVASIGVGAQVGRRARRTLES